MNSPAYYKQYTARQKFLLKEKGLYNAPYFNKFLLCSISDELSRRKEFEETSEKENTTNKGNENVLEFVNELQKYARSEHEFKWVANKSVIDRLTMQ